MRKKTILLIALMLSLAHVARANDIEPTKEFYTATRAGSAVTLDGVLSEWSGVPVLADPRFSIPKGSGDNGTLVLFEPYQGGTWTGPDDHTSAVQIVWDADNVYFGFVVTDDYHENSRNSAWNGDSIQLMIANGARNAQVALYNYALGGVEDATEDVIIQHEAGSGPGIPAPGVTDAIVTRNSVTKKTTYEIIVPAAALGMTPPLTAGTQFGLGMAINDGDAAAGQDGQKGWGGLGAHAIVFGKTPGETALVTLGAQGPTVDRLFFSAINPTLTTFSFRATDKGTSIVNPTTARLTIDGAVVALVASAKTGDATDFTYTRSTPFPAGSDHTYIISVTDTQGNEVTAEGTFKTINYATLTAAMAVTGVDKTKPGFQVRVWQVDTTAALVNSNERSDQELFGELGANIADLSLADPATGIFIDEDIINYDQDGVDRGTFPFDEFIPGIPGTTSSTDNFAAEFLTFIEFPAAGLYTMVVNSDDGFRTAVSRNPRDRFQAGSLMLGEFNGGRGSTDTAFTFYVDAPGIYPFRTTWEEGGVDANIEWSHIAADGTPVLINDLTNPSALKAYRAGPIVDRAYIASVKPGVGVLASPSTTIEAVVVDANTSLVAGTVKMKFDAADVTPTVTSAGGKTTITYTPAKELTAGNHTVELSYDENTTPATTRSVTFSFKVAFTPADLPGNTFIIEAEDFDFDGGQTLPVASTMPYDGGAYQDLGATKGVDFNNNDDVVGQGGDLYRTEADPDPELPNDPDGLNEVAIGDNLGGRWGRERGAYEVSTNFKIGWTADGDWQNYTRTIPAGIYTAYAALSYDGTAPDQLRGSLDLVTAGAGTPNQTLARLGRFSQNGSGGWGANDLVPMSVGGGQAFFKLPGGNVTLRFNLGSGDFDWLALSPVSGIPPSVKSAVPVDGEFGAALNQIKIVVEDFSTQLVASSVKLSVDGQEVAAGVTKNADLTTITFTPSFTANASHTYTVTGLDSANAPFSYTSTFTTFPIAGNVIVIEAEDFNYDGGQTKAEASVMPYFGNAYNGLGAVEGVDFVNNDGNDSDVYRTEKPDTGEIENEVNINDNLAGQLGASRGQWYVTTNYKIGWVEAGSWQNYTRTIPQGNYEVYAALSFDGQDASLLRGTLQRVIGPANVPDQTVEDVGVFDAPGSSGWGRNNLVAMTDVVGGAKKIIALGGTQTLRFNLDSGDFDYLLLVPASAQPPTITMISRANGNVTIEWTGGGTLEVTDKVIGGTWNDTGLTSPASIPESQMPAVQFGRIRR